MKDLIFKFNLLDPFRKEELLDFLEFLLNKQKSEKVMDFKSYKASILKVSTWEADAINEMEQNQKRFNQWPIQDW